MRCYKVSDVLFLRERNMFVADRDIYVEKLRHGSFVLNVPSTGAGSVHKVRVQRMWPVVRVQCEQVVDVAANCEPLLDAADAFGHCEGTRVRLASVSYTHLTLPTILLV
eukprot:6205396-Pleurochrysis_carterae.AAC.1